MTTLNNWNFDSTVAGQLESGTTLVTASKRLARELHQQFNLYQHNKGIRAWRTADILPCQAWVHRSWQLQRNNGGNGKVAISPLQSKHIWEDTIRRDIAHNEVDTEPLWNISATVNIAMDAWRLCREWNISIDDCARSPVADHRSFARWARSFIRTCDQNLWIDSCSLADDLCMLLKTALRGCNDHVVLYGFYTISPQLQSLLDNLIAAGASITTTPPCNHNEGAPPGVLRFDSAYDQWLSAAHWARSQIETAGRKRVGIVVPDLHNSRELIDHALTEVLAPGFSFEPDTGGARPFHISLGRRLIDIPVIEAAAELLSLFTGEALETPVFSKILRSTFIGAAQDEMHQRSRLELECASDLHRETDLSYLTQWLSQRNRSHGVPRLLAIIEQAQGHAFRFRGKYPLSKWADIFPEYLGIWGWPGEQPLNSTEFQAVDAFSLETGSLRSLDLVCEDVTAARAIQILLDQLQERIFEAESPQVAVEVLDIQEAAGIEFDEIWLGNLNERDWPPRLHRSPFVPANIQREAGIHRAIPALNLELAQVQQSQIATQADATILSYQRFEDDLELLPSTLIRGAVNPGEPGLSLISQLRRQAPELEPYNEQYGIPANPGQTSGGVSLISDQAACPFRAYAIHRLGCHQPRSRLPGLDAGQRGSLVHEVLERVWLEIESSSKLKLLSDGELRTVIADHVRAGSKSYYHRAGLGNGFLAVQGQWLQRLLLEWFNVERSRDQQWQVLALENKYQLSLGNLVLNLKIDRIDRLADDSLALIDYKTGIADSVTHWVGERPRSPQLPLYLLAAMQGADDTHSVFSALLFAQVRLGEAQYSGISPDKSFQHRRQSTIKVTDLSSSRLGDEFSDWNSLVGHWRKSLKSLSVQFEQGFAAVDPVNNACDNCSLQGFCRIHQWNLENG